MTNKPNGTLYVGSTNDLIKRVYEHKQNFVQGFTKKYQLHRLVYFEGPIDLLAARHREYLIKRWKRKWKLELIEKNNPTWEDLYKNTL